MANHPSQPGPEKYSTPLMITIAVALLLLTREHAPAAYGNTPRRYPVLAACTRFEYRIFEELDFKDKDYPGVLDATDINNWKEKYHDTVGAVLEEDLGSSTDTCAGGVMQAKSKLRGLAMKLPSWHESTWDLPVISKQENNGSGPPDSGSDIINKSGESLTQAHLGVVLLEYLQMYECALVERSLFLPTETLEQEGRRRERLKELKEETQQQVSQTETDIAQTEAEMSGITDPEVFSQLTQRLSVLHGTLDLLTDMLNAINSFISKILDIAGTLELYSLDRHEIITELILARRSLHRSLAFTGALGRLKPIDADIKCIQQATLDIRNGFALAADASSCLPRIWNAKDPLRDYK